jgi:hypothetical protein
MDEVLTELTCDICKRKAPSPSRYNPWAEGRFDVTDVRVRYEDGDSYPEGGGSGDEVFFDICPECFVNRVVPAIEAMGATLQTEHKQR